MCKTVQNNSRRSYYYLQKKTLIQFPIDSLRFKKNNKIQKTFFYIWKNNFYYNS